jgi:hypothetical protein
MFIEFTELRLEHHISEIFDKELNPLLTCLGAPGTGKSSLAERGLKMLSCSKNSDLKKLLNNNPLAIHITFNSDSKFGMNDGTKGAEWAISIRLLSSYFRISISELYPKLIHYSVTVLQTLYFIEKHHRLYFHIPINKCLLVYIAVDDVDNILNDKVSDVKMRRNFLKEVTNILGTLLTLSVDRLFFVTLLTGTIHEDIKRIMSKSSHPYENLPVELLSYENMVEMAHKSLKNKKYVANDKFKRLLCEIGGIPRLCSVVFDILNSYKHYDPYLLKTARRKAFKIIEKRYNVPNDYISFMSEVIWSAITRNAVQINKQIKPGVETTYGDLQENGVIFLQRTEDDSSLEDNVDGDGTGYTVCIPTIMLKHWLDNGRPVMTPFLKAIRIMFETAENCKHWKDWEMFNVHYDVVLSEAYREFGEVSFKDYYRGALISESIINEKFKVSPASVSVLPFKYRFPQSNINLWNSGFEQLIKQSSASINAAGAAIDAIAANESTSIADNATFIRSFQMKHTIDANLVDLCLIEKEFKENDRLIGDLSVHLGRKLSNINILFSNRNQKVGSGFSSTGKRVIVTSKHLKNFYGATFYPWVQLFKRIVK